MNTLRKYFVSVFAAVVLSLTMASVTAMACPYEDDTDAYYCQYTGEDSCFCYYSCTCKVDIDSCHLALFRNGYSLIPPAATE